MMGEAGNSDKIAIRLCLQDIFNSFYSAQRWIVNFFNGKPGVFWGGMNDKTYILSYNCADYRPCEEVPTPDKIVPLWIPDTIRELFGECPKDFNKDLFGGKRNNRCKERVFSEIQDFSEEDLILFFSKFCDYISSVLNSHLRMTTYLIEKNKLTNSTLYASDVSDYESVDEYTDNKGLKTYISIRKQFYKEIMRGILDSSKYELSRIPELELSRVVENENINICQRLTLLSLLAILAGCEDDNPYSLDKEKIEKVLEKLQPVFQEEPQDNVIDDSECCVDPITGEEKTVQRKPNSLVDLGEKTLAKATETNELIEKKAEILENKLSEILLQIQMKNELSSPENKDGWQCIVADGITFEGQFSNGKMTGIGRMILQDNTVIEGTWTNGHMTSGAVKYTDGGVYEGAIKSGRPNGYGKRTYPDKSVYEGEWEDGIRKGQGKLTAYQPSGATRIFDGTWGINGDPYSGEGKITYSEHQIFKGKWRLFQGVSYEQGTMFYLPPDGGVYVGSLVDGKRNGQGEKWDEETETRISCVWTDDEMTDKVVMRFKNGQVYEGQPDPDNGEHYHGKLTNADNSWYEGDWKDGLPDGMGKRLYSDGKYYEGAWKSSIPNGKGKMVYPDKQTYEGDWVEGAWNGFGRMTLPDGQVYEGEWKDNSLNGKGRWDFGAHWYVGEWKNGAKCGQGKGFLTDGEIYEGEWKDGYPNGQGRAVFPDNTIIEGEWKDGEIVSGREQREDGSVYEGQWTNGKWEGEGKFVTRVATYEGEWKAGMPHGKGKQTTSDGRIYEGDWEYGIIVYGIEQRGDEIVYEGGWAHGTWEGKGRITYGNGTTYEGELKNNEPNGNGKRTFPNGNVYEGEWKNAMPHGKGKMTNANGSCYEGVWANGELVRRENMNQNNKKFLELLRTDKNTPETFDLLWDEFTHNAKFYCLYFAGTDKILKLLITGDGKNLFAIFTDEEEFKKMHISSNADLQLKCVNFQEWMKSVQPIDFDGILINPKSDCAMILLETD